VLDSALLGVAAAKTKAPKRLLATAALVGPIALLDAYYAIESEREL
jgi:hypothetical protein